MPRLCGANRSLCVSNQTETLSATSKSLQPRLFYNPATAVASEIESLRFPVSPYCDVTDLECSKVTFSIELDWIQTIDGVKKVIDRLGFNQDIMIVDVSTSFWR